MRTARSFAAVSVLLLSLLVVGIGPASAQEVPPIDQLALDAPGALLSTALDNAAAQQANAGIRVANATNVTCQYDPTAANGTFEADVGPAVVKQADVATAPATECVSLQPFIGEYNITLNIVFQYYNSGTNSWVNITETAITCQTRSIFRQGALANCTDVYFYPVGHSSLNKWHRAKFDLQSPLDLEPTYSQPWPCAAASL